MRLPTIENYDNSKLINVISINKPSDLDKSYMIMNDKDKFKFIGTVEKVVRKSIEYKEYIQFLKDKIDMTQCSYFKNIDTKNSRTISIEIHHEPFTLFDITSIVVEKFIDLDLELNPFLIGEEVMKIHYENMVGLLPLTKTVHGLVHDGKLFIPLQNVFGNYLKFVEEYGHYITDDISNMLQAKLRLSKEFSEPDMSILEKKYVYIEVEGMTLPQIIEK